MLTARRTTWAAVADVEVDLDAAPSSTALGSPPPPQRLRPTSPSPSRSQSPAQSASVPLLSLQPAIPALLSALGEPELAHATSGDEREGLLQIIRRLAQHSPELQRSVARNALPTLLALLRSPVSAANLSGARLAVATVCGGEAYRPLLWSSALATALMSFLTPATPAAPAASPATDTSSPSSSTVMTSSQTAPTNTSSPHSSTVTASNAAAQETAGLAAAALGSMAAADSLTLHRLVQDGAMESLLALRASKHPNTASRARIALDAIAKSQGIDFCAAKHQRRDNHRRHNHNHDDSDNPGVPVQQRRRAHTFAPPPLQLPLPDVDTVQHSPREGAEVFSPGITLLTVHAAGTAFARSSAESPPTSPRRRQLPVPLPKQSSADAAAPSRVGVRARPGRRATMGSHEMAHAAQAAQAAMHPLRAPIAALYASTLPPQTARRPARRASAAGTGSSSSGDDVPGSPLRSQPRKQSSIAKLTGAA